MPTPAQAARNRYGVAVRTGDPAAIHAARRDLAAAKITQYVTRSLEDAPPLTGVQRAEIASLLESGATR